MNDQFSAMIHTMDALERKPLNAETLGGNKPVGMRPNQTEMTPAELVAAMEYRAAWLRRHCKVGSNIITTAAAFQIASEMEQAAEAIRAAAK